MEERQQEKEWRTGAEPKSLLSEEEEDVNAMEGLEDEIFGEPGKSRKSRSQRRKEKLQWNKEQEVSVRDDDFPASHDGIVRMQLEDETLDKIRKYVKGEIPTPPGIQFSEKSGLLYRVCGTRQKFEDEDLEQLILPVPCREKVLKLAHTIPLAGHFGQKKTANRILKRFFGLKYFMMSNNIANLVKNVSVQPERNTLQKPLWSIFLS